MPYDAPYSGGTAPGGRLFVVDGDFRFAAPCSAPEISTPFKGDTFQNVRDIIILNEAGSYVNVPPRISPNINPFAANQTTIIIEQDFMVAQAYYLPMPLNSLYNPAWSVGWSNNYANLENCYLVEESRLEDQGGGIVKFRRKFASLPPTRNERESYMASFPALSNGTDSRLPIQRIAASRIQNDYVLLGTFGYPDLGVTLPEMRYFKAMDSPLSAIYGNYLIDPDQALTDADPTDPSSNPTNPSFSQYVAWLNGIGCTGGLAPEIIAEASTFTRWLGNIYCRSTRFVVVQ